MRPCVTVNQALAWEGLDGPPYPHAVEEPKDAIYLDVT